MPQPRSKAANSTTTPPAGHRPPVEERLIPPDIARWRIGNTDVGFVHRHDSGKPGPHVLMTALMHGNEACGAIALDRMLAEDLMPGRGVLMLAFLNVAAYAHIDPARPDRGRFIDEDMNRLWSPNKLDGPGQTVELRRARALRPFIDAADYLLDLHSMTEDSPPLLLCGMTEKGMTLARKVGFPATVVADPGHAGGTRLRDYGSFGTTASEKAALLVECGPHFSARSAEVAFETSIRFLKALDMGDPAFEARHLGPPPPEPQRFIKVTHVITIETNAFAFTRPCCGLEVIPEAGTLLARDGTREIRTPYDDCIAIMPAKKPRRGLTAVRLGHFIEAPSVAG